MSIEVRLAGAQERVRLAEAAVKQYVDRDANRHWTEVDSATGSGIRRKPNAKADARRFASYDKEADAYRELEEARANYRRLERIYIESSRPVLGRSDVLGAKYVRTRGGWQKVVRVNDKTVTVETPYSWTDRVNFEKVLEVLG